MRKANADYDAWFRCQVAEGIADARAGRVRSSRSVEKHFAKRRLATKEKTAQSRAMNHG
jgi:hypothetical protein